MILKESYTLSKYRDIPHYADTVNNFLLVVATFALAVVTFNLVNVSQKQAEIMNRQSKIMSKQSKIMRRQANISENLKDIEKIRLKYQKPNLKCGYQKREVENKTKIELRVYNSGEFAVLINQIIARNPKNVYLSQGETNYNGTGKKPVAAIIGGESQSKFEFISKKTNINAVFLKLDSKKKVYCEPVEYQSHAIRR